MAVAKVDRLTEAKAVLERAHTFWEYYARDVYSSQMGIVKTYLWVAITLLTAQAVIYDRFQNWICFKFWDLRCIAFSLAVFSAFCAMIVGLSCLSKIFLAKTGFTVPSNDAEHEINSLEQSDYLAATRYTVIKAICSNYDHAYNELAKIINQRGYRMRTQCVCCILSALCTFVLVISIVVNGG